MVPLPAVYDELPAELRLVFPGEANPALTADPTTPASLDPETTSQRRLWADSREPHPIIVTTAFGIPQKGSAARERSEDDLHVDVEWDILDAPDFVPTTVIGAMRAATKGRAETRAPAPIDDVAWLVPEDNRDAFVAEADRFFHGGKLPGGILNALDQVRRYGQDSGTTPAEFARFGIGNALERDGILLGRKQRRKCGAMTQERRTLTAEGREVRSLRRLLCQSHRCPRCAPILAARWKARIQAQVDRDLDAGRDQYVLITLTLSRRGYQNAATASKLVLGGKKGPWRSFIERLRRRYPGAAFLRIVEFHQDGWPHLHVLVRSEALVDAMVAQSGLDGVAALRARVIEVKAENDLRKAAGVKGRIHSPYAKMRVIVRDLALKSGFGGDAFDLDLVLNPEGIGAELAKTTQHNPDMPRGVRRFQASGKAGDRKDKSFFHDEWRKPFAEAPVPPVSVEAEQQPSMGLVGTAEVKVPEGAPELPIGGDARPGPGHLRVRIETVTTDECRLGERLVLQLRILEPEGFAHGRHRCTIPYAFNTDLAAMLRSVLGLIHIDAVETFDKKWLLGQDGWVQYEPRGALIEETGEPRRWDGFNWVVGPVAPDAMAVEVRNEIPMWALDTATGPAVAEGTLIESVLHLAPLDEVVAAYAGDRPDVRFCGARVEAALADDGTLVRRLTACQEALLARQGVEALVDYIDVLAALQALGPPDVREANDLRSIVAGVRALMRELATNSA
jgi:hypothetical protein